MDPFSSKTPRAYTLIRALFWILFSIMLVSVVMLFVLDTYEIVQSNEGEIMAENTPIEYFTPFEAEIKEIFVKESDFVHQGDTLLKLYSSKIATDYKQAKTELSLARNNIKLYKEQLNSLKSIIKHQKKERGNLKSGLRIKKRSENIGVKGLENQLEGLQQKLNMSEKSLKKEKRLLRKGAISEQEYNQKYQAYLDEQNAYAEVYNKYLQKKIDTETLPSEHATQLGQAEMEIISSEKDYYSTLQRLREEEINKGQLKVLVNTTKQELERQFIIADIDGYVSKLYNFHTDINYLAKKTSILKITPSKETQFVAKLTINEKAIKDVHIGQEAHLKLDAYNHYQYGILKATITHIDKELVKSKTKGHVTKFYALASLSNTYDERFKLRSGFKLKGEIILKKVKLYRYVSQKIFKK